MKTRNLLAGIFTIFVISGYAMGQELWLPNSTHIFNTNSGNVGIGTSYPSEKLHVNGSVRGNQSGAVRISTGYGYVDIGPKNTGWSHFVTDRGRFYFNKGITIDTGYLGSYNQNLYLQTSGTTRMTILNSNGNVGIGTYPESKLHVNGNIIAGNTSTTSTTIRWWNADRMWEWYANATSDFFGIYDRTAAAYRLAVDYDGNVGIGTTNPGAKLDVNGTTRTKVIEITGGADLAEPFEIAGTESIKPGMVVSIDPEQPGELRVSSQAYDRTVAGIISGAGGVNPGILMTQTESGSDSEYPVALTGRVYARADATEGPIKPGDLLTTSDSPGHVMKVTDHARSQGAIIGKAMSSLDEGRGLILVLVALQ